MLSRPEFDDAFVDFIREGVHGGSMDGVAASDNLFDAGVLDSFSVVRVIAFLEGVIGTPIDLAGASIESFATLDRIYETFVEPHSSSIADPW